MIKLSRKVLIVALVGGIFVSVGCYSVKMRTEDPKPEVYPGLKYSSDANATWTDHSLRVVDYPISFAFDTVLLPYDLVRVAFKGSGKKKTAPEDTDNNKTDLKEK